MCQRSSWCLSIFLERERLFVIVPAPQGFVYPEALAWKKGEAFGIQSSGDKRGDVSFSPFMNRMILTGETTEYPAYKNRSSRTYLARKTRESEKKTYYLRTNLRCNVSHLGYPIRAHRHLVESKRCRSRSVPCPSPGGQCSRRFGEGFSLGDIWER